MNAVHRAAEASFGPASARSPVLAFLCDEETIELVCRVVPGGRRGVEVREGGIHAALSNVQGGASAEVLIVDISNSGAPANDIAALATICGAGTTILAVGPDNDVTLYRALIAGGATDYLVKPLTSQELRRTILTANRSHRDVEAEARSGHVAVVGHSRGGVGGSTIAVGVAWLLANESKKNVALIDLDVHFGTAALSLDIEPGSGLRNALSAPDRIDSLFIASALINCGEHLHVMSGEEAIDEDLQIQPESLERLVAETRSIFDVVVVDLPRHLLGVSAPMLAKADSFALVSDLSLASLRDTLRIRASLERMAPQLKPAVVANRVGAQKPGQLTIQEFERGLGGRTDFRIPEDAKAAKASLDGRPFTAVGMKGKTGDALRGLARSLAADEPAAAPARTWFRRRT